MFSRNFNKFFSVVYGIYRWDFCEFISYIGIFNDAPSYPFFHSDLDIKRKFQFKSRFQNSNSAAILFDTYFAGFLYALNYRAFIRETKYTLEEPEQSSFHLTDGLSRSTESVSVCCLGHGLLNIILV